MNCPAMVAAVKGGIRCIATHLKPEPPSQSALTARAIQLKQKPVGAGLGEGYR
ncbi:hypothetical protein [Microcoleus sp. K4-C2]|uniref:hypothetical protein n=1 Tax=Microcoleus sp. K4-C2 TaxID=2818792 RepID=UPI002FCF468A